MKFKVLTLLLNTMGVLWRGIVRQRVWRPATLALLFVGGSAIADAQVALKTNVLYDVSVRKKPT